MPHSPHFRMLCLLLVIGLDACSIAPPKKPHPIDLNVVYSTNDASSGLLAQHAPLLRIENGHREFNKIGTVIASRDEKGKERIQIDTRQATLYSEQISFQGQHGRYTNLIYRFHFNRVPFSVLPFNLTYGRNVGLFVIITLNEDDKPVLVSTVHSCGCYLAFVPTDQLIDSAYPAGWSKNSQSVQGETLPGFLEKISDKSRFIIDLRNSSHRVYDLSLVSSDHLSNDRKSVPMRLEPISNLRNLPLGDEKISMFAQRGVRKGYVKGSHKPFEALLMSWWAFDPRIGVDKDYGDPEKTGTIFYTSLKPWNRKASNMWPFTDFLEFWDWSL